MKTIGEVIRKLRKDSKQPLRVVAANIGIDAAILSKIERGQRNVSKLHVMKFAEYFNVSENELMVEWLSDKLVNQLADEQVAIESLLLAEEKLSYLAFKKIDRKQLISKLKLGIKKFPDIEKAWIYGSFSRNDDGPKSDIDIAFKTNATFTYFDLAEVQHQLEKSINRKVDVGFIDAFKPYIFANVEPDLKLIYEK